MGFGGLLLSDHVNAIPVALQLLIASVVHFDLGRAAQRCQRHHDTAHFKIRTTDRSIIDVFDQSDRVFARTTIRLRQLQRFLEKAVRPFGAIRPNRSREAGL